MVPMVGGRARPPGAPALRCRCTPSRGGIPAGTGVASTVLGHAVDMSREIPSFVRAAAGLAATVVDEARKLPQMLPGLPVRVVGLAMQSAMKVQQGYSGLVARGDEVFTGIRG